ncbi:MAG: tandem-95 repeat protein, partial [Gemmatimonadetes bacterium]|nr:tandem-95 repeat protein [Gemmatimonadota bacterium]
DAYATDEDVTLIVPAPGVLDNDTDLEGDYPLAVDSYTAPAVGTLTMDAPGDGSFTYEPAPDHNGVVTFTYRARDSMGGVSEPATVTITVNPVNDPPEATPQHVSTPEDTDLAIQLGGTDIEGDPLAATVTALPADGQLFQTADGSTPSDEITSVPATVTDALARVVYRPAPNEYDSPYAQFEFVVNDGAVDSAPATVTVNVLPVNDAPVAEAQSVTTDEDVSVDFALSGSDVEGSSLTSAMWSPPAHGSVVVNADGTGTYTPDADYNGADSFEFTVFDGELTSEPAVVSITVNPVNDPPVIVPRDFVTDEDTPLVLVLEAGDVDGDVLVFSVTTPPSHGVLALSPDGTGTYEPDLDYFGPDSFEYEVWDGAVAVAGASAITVNPVNDAPVASDVGPVTAIEGEPLAITLPASDVDSPTLTFEVVAGPGHGVVTIAGEIATYTADRYDYTPDGFTFRAFDGELYSEAAVVSITVIPAYPTDYALFASGSKWASVGLQARVEGGLVGGNRNVVIHSFAQVEGVSAGGDVSVMARARTGDIVAGGTVKVHRGAEVGTVTEGAVVYAPRMPEVNAEPGSQDIKRSVRDARRGPLDLAPGAYGKVDTAIQDRLILHGGEYHCRELNVDLASKITVDLSNGQPLLVRVAGNLNFGIGVRMEVVGGDASRVAFLVGGRHARLGMSGTYCGTFAAPEGKVYVGFGADLTGAAWGEDIDAATRARITRSPYTAW